MCVQDEKAETAEEQSGAMSINLEIQKERGVLSQHHIKQNMWVHV